MVCVLASITVREGCLQPFLEAFKANVPNVLAEDGCIEYAPAIDVETGLAPQALDARVVTVVEKWESLDHLRAHLIAPHMVEYKARTAECVDNVSLKVLRFV